MASEIADLSVKLSLDGKGAKAEMSDIEKKGDGLGSKLGKVAGGIGKALTAAFAASTAAVVAFSKSSIDAFNEQEKALAKLEQSAKNQGWAEEATADLMAYNAELQKIGIIGDEVNAAGQAQLGTFGLSAEAVKTLTPAMDDLIAATAGYEATTDSATQMANLMGKVMTGSVSALTRYGVTLDDNQKALLENGDEMTRAAVLAEVLKQNYGGFNEALAQTPQGQIKQLSNNFGDLKEQFGAFIAGKGDLTGFFDQLDVVFNNVVDLTKNLAPQVLEGVSTLMTAVATKLPKLIADLAPIITDAIVSLGQSFIEALPELLQSVVDIAFAIMNGLMEKLPQILTSITNAIIGITKILTNPANLQKLLQAGITLLMQLVKATPQIIKALVAALPDIIDGVISFLTDTNNIGLIMGAAAELFLGIVMAVPEILGSLLGAFSTLVGNLWNGITQMFGGFAADFGNFIGNIFKAAINGVIAFIENMLNTPINLINGFIDIINGAFGFIGVNLGHINLVSLPRLAQGGLATGATTAVIGEAGREAVLPLERNTDNWSGLLAATLAEEFEERDLGEGGRPIVVNFYDTTIRNDDDIKRITQGISQVMRRQAI